MSAETGLPWNDGAAPRVCHCSDCDAPDEPACQDCGRDGEYIYLDGRCEPCHDKAVLAAKAEW